MPTLGDIDFNQLGKHQVEITIKALEPNSKNTAGWVVLDGFERKLKYITSGANKFAMKLEPGAKQVAEISIEEDEYNGVKSKVPFIRSFGGPSPTQQRGNGSSKPFTPRSPEEIHASSVAGIVKSTLDYCKDLNEFDKVFEKAIHAYKRGVDLMSGKANAAQATPQEAPVQEPVPATTNPPAPAKDVADPAFAAKADADSYWQSIGGDAEQHNQLREACRAAGLKFWDVILEGKASNADPTSILRMVNTIAARGKVEPGVHRNSTSASGKSSETLAEEEPEEIDYYVEFTKLCELHNWPTFGADPTACKTIYTRVLGRTIRSAIHLTPHDYYQLFLWAKEIEAGREEEPFSFKAYAKDKKSA